MNTCLIRSDSVLAQINLAPHKYVDMYMCIGRDAYYIRIQKVAQLLEVHVIVTVRV